MKSKSPLLRGIEGDSSSISLIFAEESVNKKEEKNYDRGKKPC
jgi:hypothetical protein